MFENILINDIHASRYIASWLNAGGALYYVEDVDQFCTWLKSMGLSDYEVLHIREIATCGKLELENSAKKFVEELSLV